MKKNYFKPAIVASAVVCEHIMEASIPIGGDATQDADIKDFEDISSDLFGNESFGGAEEW